MIESRQDIREEDLKNWKLLERFQTILLPQLQGIPVLASEEDPRRKLTREGYFSLFLFGLLNPIVTSMRGLCAATKFRKMREVCAAPVSSTAFSEAQHLFKPDILANIVRQLARQAKGMPEFGDPQVRAAVQALTIADGSIFRAVNRMLWTPASGSGCAVRLNLHFSAFDQVPEDWSITPGQVSELKAFKKMAKPGSMYVGDRLYSLDHLFLKQMKKEGVDFVVRLMGHIIRTPIHPPRPLTEEDRQAGVVSDQIVELG